MTDGAADDRSAALETYLAQRGGQGFRVETRSELQAVIVRRHPLHFALRWLAKDRAEQRLVVSVDEHGKVAAVPAQPLRW
jgi:type II secretory pathway component PulM